jgi:predicted nuclease with RNAse H fold
MANLESVIHRLQRALKNRVNALAISVTSGGVDNMETYKYTIGQINALESVRQELSNLLEDKEQNDGTIVDIKRGKTDPLTK